MSTISIFDNWYDKLSDTEKSKILNHIIETKMEVCMEGVFSGPAGQLLNKGLYSGPAGQLLTSKCPQCGR